MTVDEIQKRSAFNYWFERKSGCLEVYHLQEPQDVYAGFIVESSTGAQYIPNSEYTNQYGDREKGILEQFSLFKGSRPEYLVYSAYEIPSIIKTYEGVNKLGQDDISYLRSTFITLMQGICLIRGYKNKIVEEGSALLRAAKILEWIDGTDFYQSPASTKYHEAFEGGLLLHTLRVVSNIISLIDTPKFKNIVSVDSAVLCAMVHDFCKINNYEKYTYNVKNEATNKWESKEGYKHKGEPVYPLGHGESSMYIAMTLFKLTVEEAVAVRQHMGKWAAETSYNINDLQYANENYPLVLLLQFADQLACVNY